MRRGRLFIQLLTFLAFTPLAAQDHIYNEQLLPSVREAAGMIPGAAPTAVNVLVVAHIDAPPSYLIEEIVPAWEGVQTEYQIQYPDGWIAVDAAGDHAAGSPGFSEDAFQQSTSSLLGARLIITTHEHGDHVWGIIHSPHSEQYAKKTILTVEQLHRLVTAPSRTELALTEEQARSYLTVSYGRVLPIAPGVVLIKAPGHTPGGQMVYVRLESGKEIILSGDVVWQKEAIDRGLQKPDGISEQLGEDRDEIAPQLPWLRTVEQAGVAVVVFHDMESINELIEQGVLGRGFELH